MTGLFLAGAVMAVDLEWDPNSPDQGVIGYYVYWQPADGSAPAMQAQVDGINNTHVTIDNTNFTYNVPYTMWATAFNTDEESGPSNTIDFVKPWPGGIPIVPNQPSGFRFSDTAGTMISADKIKVAP